MYVHCTYVMLYMLVMFYPVAGLEYFTSVQHISIQNIPEVLYVVLGIGKNIFRMRTKNTISYGK